MFSLNVVFDVRSVELHSQCIISVAFPFINSHAHSILFSVPSFSFRIHHIARSLALCFACVGFCSRRAAFEHFVRVSAAERRRAERIMNGGSLGRNFSRSNHHHGNHSQDNHYETLERSSTFSSPQNSYKSDTGSISSNSDKRKTSLRVSETMNDGTNRK